ncbi:MAG: PEP-CTERM sorting domain-containing protein [Phycisphaerales bacterium]|nr:PEP-CTERM sorting domain-containing protein [Phycisphaerales bacterium]
MRLGACSMVAALVMSGGISSASVYFLEAENYDDASSVTTFDQNSGGVGGAPMSNGYYVTIDNVGTGKLLFQIAQGDLPPGTYNVSDRGYNSTATRELDLQVASGLVGINDAGFSLVGTTNNVNNAGPAYPIEWRRLYSDTTGSTLATITMPVSGGITLRYIAQGSAAGSSDVLAFMTAGESLPDNLVPQNGTYTPQIPVPEPGSIGLLMTAGLLALRRRRRA